MSASCHPGSSIRVAERRRLVKLLLPLSVKDSHTDQLHLTVRSSRTSCHCFFFLMKDKSHDDKIIDCFSFYTVSATHEPFKAGHYSNLNTTIISSRLRESFSQFGGMND